MHCDSHNVALVAHTDAIFVQCITHSEQFVLFTVHLNALRTC